MRGSIRAVPSFVGGLLFGIFVARITMTPRSPRDRPLQDVFPASSSASASLLADEDESPSALSPAPSGRSRHRHAIGRGGRRSGGIRAGRAAGHGRSGRSSSAPIRAHAAGNTPPGEPWEARTLGPYYGDLEAPGEFERMIRTAALHSREIIVLHGLYLIHI